MAVVVTIMMSGPYGGLRRLVDTTCTVGVHDSATVGKRRALLACLLALTHLLNASCEVLSRRLPHTSSITSHSKRWHLCVEGQLQVCSVKRRCKRNTCLLSRSSSKSWTLSLIPGPAGAQGSPAFSTGWSWANMPSKTVLSSKMNTPLPCFCSSCHCPWYLAPVA